MTSDPAGIETLRVAGRSLPPPQKPKKRGHQAPNSEETPVVDVREEPQQAPSPEPPAASAVATARPASQGSAAKQRPATAAFDKGPAKTIYSDTQIDDFLHQVRVGATVARLDLTHSAVWRLAMHEFMERHPPADVVQHFTQDASKTGQIGRPKR